MIYCNVSGTLLTYQVEPMYLIQQWTFSTRRWGLRSEQFKQRLRDGYVFILTPTPRHAYMDAAVVGSRGANSR